VLTEKAWHNRAGWGRDEWNAWETWGWYRQFCRVVRRYFKSCLIVILTTLVWFWFWQYEPYLRNYSNTLWTVSFAKFEGSTDPAAELLIKIWNVATGGET